VSIFEGSGSAGATFPVAEGLGPEVLDAATACIVAGAMVSFGLSRDGGAMSMSVMSFGRTARKWAGDVDELIAVAGEFLAAAQRGDFEPPPNAVRRGS